MDRDGWRDTVLALLVVALFFAVAWLEGHP